ncbi:hypothetical protein BDZ89DRAFT_329364 [Hymenopellis radicata]|nr:hypothetical protein BDZ89DRAFT_329364 [Hymenopellis radicata]
MDYDRLSAMVRCSRSLEFDEMSHKVLVTRPGRLRAQHRLEYVSPFVEMLMRDQLQTAWANNCADFISLCHPNAMSRRLAAPALELGFHSKLVEGGQYYLTALANGGPSHWSGIEEEERTVNWEADIEHGPTHLLAIGRHRDQVDVSVALHCSSDSAPHLVSALLPRKFFSPTNPPLPTFTAYWQPTRSAVDHMAFDSLIFDAPTNTVFLFQLQVHEICDTKASSVLFVRQYFPNATIHYILVSHRHFANTLFGNATSQWLPSKWHLRMNLNAPAAVVSELQNL